MDEDEAEAEADRKKMDEDGAEGVDVDPDAMAFIKSRKDVLKLRNARKNQWDLSRGSRLDQTKAEKAKLRRTCKHRT